jgi:REP element-mobilizing transposase RayT
MARGNQGCDIYAGACDRKLSLETLAEAWEKTGWRLHAWVMMSNRYHLLLETPEANLAAGMKWFQGTYTQRYNSRHGAFGRLCQGRCKAWPWTGRRAITWLSGNFNGDLFLYPFRVSTRISPC